MAKHAPKSRMTDRRRETREKRRPPPPQRGTVPSEFKRGTVPYEFTSCPHGRSDSCRTPSKFTVADPLLKTPFAVVRRAAVTDAENTRQADVLVNALDAQDINHRVFRPIRLPNERRARREQQRMARAIPLRDDVVHVVQDTVAVKVRIAAETRGQPPLGLSRKVPGNAVARSRF